MVRTLTVLAFLLSAPLRAADLGETYFTTGWAKSESVPPPAAAPGQPAGEKPIGDLHNPVAHMDITVKAFQVYAAQYSGGELAQFIGEAGSDAPASDSDDNVVAGSYDEDKSFKNPWNEMLPMERHFWECRQGYFKGWQGHDSSLNRAYKYWSGGYGIDGKFDSGFEKNGTKDEGVLGLYRKGEKAKAYWYLGHVAHLVEDLTVPAHALLFTHVGEGTDAYETYMKHHYGEWAPGSQSPLESYEKLYDLFLKTAEVTNDFDAGSGPGDSGVDGKKDQGARRAGGFSEDQLKEEGAVLMPLAYRRVASLFLFFFKQIDHAPPKVTLAQPVSDSSVVSLAATASDEISGVDRRGFRFEYRVSGQAGWRAVAPRSGSSVLFRGEPGRQYSFRVIASDAAGNRGIPLPRSWKAGPLSIAAR